MQQTAQQDPAQAYMDAVQKQLSMQRISAAQTQADANQLPAIQSELAQNFDNILRMYGQRSALVGGAPSGGATPAAAVG